MLCITRSWLVDLTGDLDVVEVLTNTIADKLDVNSEVICRGYPDEILLFPFESHEMTRHDWSAI